MKHVETPLLISTCNNIPGWRGVYKYLAGHLNRNEVDSRVGNLAVMTRRQNADMYCNDAKAKHGLV